MGTAHLTAFGSHLPENEIEKPGVKMDREEAQTAAQDSDPYLKAGERPQSSAFMSRPAIITLPVRFLNDRPAGGALPGHGFPAFQETVKPALRLQPQVNLMPGAGYFVSLADFA